MRDDVNRLANLDLLRLAAALMIVAFHFGYRGPATAGWTPSAFPEFAPVAREMWAGVSFFFIISGFVIAWSAEKRDAYAFAVARVARLYPAFVVCMCVSAAAMALLAPPGVDEFRMTLARWAANLPLVSKAFGQPFVDGAYWSIVVEAVFYGWVALLLALGLFQKRLHAILAIWLIVGFLNEIYFQNKALQHLLVTRHAGYFMLGILSYAIFRKGGMPMWREAGLGVAAFALCLADDRAYVGWMAAELGYAQAWSPTFAALKLAAMLVILNVAVRMRAALPVPVCMAMGGLTYPLYLLHQNLGYVLMHRLDPALGGWGALAAATAVVAAAAWLVHRHVEPGGRAWIIRAGDALRHGLAGWMPVPRRG